MNAFSRDFVQRTNKNTNGKLSFWVSGVVEIATRVHIMTTGERENNAYDRVICFSAGRTL